MRLVLSLALCLVAAAPRAARAVEPPVILVVGDSLSAGYGLDARAGLGGTAAAAAEEAKVTVTVSSTPASPARRPTAACSGSIARSHQHNPRIVIIELGGNDGLRGLPVSRVRANLELLITKSRAAGAEVLLVAIRVPTNYGPQYTTSFQEHLPRPCDALSASASCRFLSNDQVAR